MLDTPPDILHIYEFYSTFQPLWQTENHPLLGNLKFIESICTTLQIRFEYDFFCLNDKLLLIEYTLVGICRVSNRWLVVTGQARFGWTQHIFSQLPIHSYYLLNIYLFQVFRFHIYNKVIKYIIFPGKVK